MNYVITIARRFGSGGKEIGAMLSKKLGIPVYERQILEMASQESGLSEELFGQVEEKLRGSYIKNMLEKFTFPTKVEPSSKRFYSDINLYCIQAEIIKELAKSTSCIIIGKAADHILKDFENAVRIFVDAPHKVCVKTIMEKTGANESEAVKMIKKTDKYRADYYKFYTGGKFWANPVNYDLTLNSASLSREQCLEVITSYLKIKFGEDFNK